MRESVDAGSGAFGRSDRRRLLGGALDCRVEHLVRRADVGGRGHRGLLTRLVTRMYFEDEPSNVADAVLTLVPAERRATLLAKRIADNRYRFDIALQGPHETVFFDV